MSMVGAQRRYSDDVLRQVSYGEYVVEFNMGKCQLSAQPTMGLSLFKRWYSCLFVLCEG